MRVGWSMAEWGQRDLAPEAEWRNTDVTQEKELATQTDGEPAGSKRKGYEPSDEGLFYLELFKKEQERLNQQRQQQRDMQKLMRIGSSMSKTKSSGSKKTYKRFHYNFKQISAQILSARTSGNARQVLARAKRAAVQIRRKLKSGQYDDEVVQMALTHAEAMERVAKKKMKHLQEEESARRTGGPCAGDTDEEDIREQQKQDEQMLTEMQTGQNAGSYTAATDESVPIEEVSIEELLAEAMQTPILDVTDGLEELTEDLTELMEETLEDVGGLEELADEMLSGGSRTLDPADLEEKKRKHRTEEQRAIAEADSKYLKAFFNKLQREQQAAASGADKIAEAENASPAAAFCVNLSAATAVLSVADMAVPAVADTAAAEASV